jgi:hypothetical protein
MPVTIDGARTWIFTSIPLTHARVRPISTASAPRSYTATQPSHPLAFSSASSATRPPPPPGLALLPPPPRPSLAPRLCPLPHLARPLPASLFPSASSPDLGPHRRNSSVPSLHQRDPAFGTASASKGCRIGAVRREIQRWKLLAWTADTRCGTQPHLDPMVPILNPFDSLRAAAATREHPHNCTTFFVDLLGFQVFTGFSSTR